MNRSTAALIACVAFLACPMLQASNPAFKIISLGVPGATISLDGVVEAGEWAGAGPPSMLSSTSTLSGSITVLHKLDGIYILAVINDNTVNDADAFNLRFDIDNSGGATPDADDWGVQILRNKQATWGPAANDPSTWTAVDPTDFGVSSAATQWTVEFHLPTGPPSNLSLATGIIGAYFSFYDADDAFGANSAKYAQWPPAPVATPDAILDSDPDQWGQYIFDPKTTFPDVSVNDVRRNNGDPTKYYNIDYSGINSFEAKLTNPGGTAVADAANVRINLYLAARGIGEPWHRLDTNTTLTSDCGAAPAAWNSMVLAKTAVCNGTAPGSTPLPDISAMTINNVVAGTAQYTIQDGIVMNRTGGLGITVSGATANYYPVIDWNTTPAQDSFFQQNTVVGGTTYDRAHECMLAEAIVPNDPNPGNNTTQVNMNFIGVPFTNLLKLPFSLGWSGFAKYNPNVGRSMFLQVSRLNMPEGFRFALAGLRSPKPGVYEANLKGDLPLAASAEIEATSVAYLGKVLKENLVVRAQAGGKVARPPSGLPPVYVRVPPGSTLWIVNYALNDKDTQYVDVDGKGPIPPNGPAGLLPRTDHEKPGRLLVPEARRGELVLSFDNFKTGIGIAEGVQIRVPPKVDGIALGINDYVGEYRAITGPGFRLKITVQPTPVVRVMTPLETARFAISRPAAEAAQATPQAPTPAPTPAQPGIVVGRNPYNAVSILDVIPQVCVDGYEDTGQKRKIKSQEVEMFRYLGNVCWGVLNVFPKGKPVVDKGDKATAGTLAAQ